MKTVVFDTNELTKDWLLVGLKYQLISHMFHRTRWMDFCVPAVVFEELIANHERAVARVQDSGDKLNRERKRLGLGEAQMEPLAFDYREYLTHRFEERLNFWVPTWPKTPHEKLVHRAVNRIPPFDAKGGGYRDALVWEDVLSLVHEARDVVLVSQDGAFSGDDGKLAPELRAETDGLRGSVELVRDFNTWLLSQLPWRPVEDLPTAVAYSRLSEFEDYYVSSDFQSEVWPEAEDLGFRAEPYRFEIIDVQWDGRITPVNDGSATDDGLLLVEYDTGQLVDFTAELPAGPDLDPSWSVSEIDALGRVSVRGTIDMDLRVAVLFGEEGNSIGEISWIRRDSGVGQIPIYRPDLDPNQPPLF